MAETRHINKYSGKICRVSFYQKAKRQEERAKDLLLFFVVSGKVILNIPDRNESELCLEKDSLVVINPDEIYQINLIDGIMAEIAFLHEEIYRLLSGKKRIVNCNSEKVRNGSFEGLRVQIKRLFGVAVRNELGIVAFEKIGYDILLTLLSEYSEEIPDDDRKDSVKRWIDNVLKEPISLEDAASHFGLTQQYFSKWFKETFGVSFLKYISKRRCENACYELLDSDNTILKIALDNGFPNSASFTNSFTKIYGCSPIQYRKKHYAKDDDSRIEADKLYEYLNAGEDYSDSENEVIVECNDNFEMLKPYWRSICNFGDILRLENYDVQNQFRLLQKSIKFDSARIVLNQDDWNPQSGFYSENRILEFLYEIGIKPFFAIDYRTCPNNEEALGWIEEFFKHISHKFGLKKITIEVFYDTFFNETKAESYNVFLKRIRDIASAVQLQCEIIGPGLLLSPDGKNLEEFLRFNQDIDIVSIRCIPIEVFGGQEYSVRIMSDDNYVIHQYQLACKILEERGIQKEVLITSMANSFAEEDRLNDSSWNAARLVRSAINGYGILTSLPIETTLDILKNKSNDQKIFNGNSGLITRNELKKPSFYAYQFLTHLDEKLLYRDEHMIVTESFNGYFQIVLQNCCPLSYEYYLNGVEGKTEFLNAEDIFETKNSFKSSLVLKNLPEGEWFMKVRKVNEHKGNVVYAFSEMQYEDFSFVGMDEMEYLKLSSCPEMHGLKIKCQDGQLRIPIDLEANEIQHIHLIPVR